MRMRGFFATFATLVALATLVYLSHISVVSYHSQAKDADSVAVYVASNAALATKRAVVDRMKHDMYESFSARAAEVFPVLYGQYGCTSMGCDIENLQGSGCPDVIPVEDPYSSVLSDLSPAFSTDFTHVSSAFHPETDLNISASVQVIFSDNNGLAVWDLVIRESLPAELEWRGRMVRTFRYGVRVEDKNVVCICNGTPTAYYTKRYEYLREYVGDQNFGEAKIASFYLNKTGGTGTNCILVET